MIIWRVTTQRFLLIFCTVHSLLTALHVLIDLFEKTTRSGHATMAEVVTYLGLNMLPLTFEITTQSLSIATGLMIREIDQAREWEAYQLINIPLRIRVLPVAVIVCGIAGFGALCNEVMIGAWKVRALTYKQTFLQKRDADPVMWRQPQHEVFVWGTPQQTQIHLTRTNDGTCHDAWCRTDVGVYHCTSNELPRPIAAQQEEQYRYDSCGVELTTVRGWHKKYTDLLTHGCDFQARRALQKMYERGIQYILAAVYPITALTWYWRMVGRGVSWWWLAIIPYCMTELLVPLIAWVARLIDCAWLVFIPLLGICVSWWL